MWFNFCVNIPNEDLINRNTFVIAKRLFLLAEFNEQRETTDSILLSSCRSSPQIDPILWLPMTNYERSLFFAGVLAGYLVANQRIVFYILANTGVAVILLNV